MSAVKAMTCQASLHFQKNRDALKSCWKSANQQLPGSSEFMILSAQNNVVVYYRNDNQIRNVLQIIEHYITQSVTNMQLLTHDIVTVVPPIMQLQPRQKSGCLLL